MRPIKLLRPAKPSNLFEGFEDHIKRSEGCWLWTGGTTGLRRSRYGLFKGERAHRIAYSLWMADIPYGMFVCHHCDNPLCVRPDHLFLGTAQDNSDDMVRKGRQDSKLTPEQVIQIRELVRNFSNALVARAFDIAESTVRNIKTRRSWKHLTA